MLTNYYLLNITYMLVFVLTMTGILGIFQLLYIPQNVNLLDDDDGLWQPNDDWGFDLPPGVSLPDGGTRLFISEPELATV